MADEEILASYTLFTPPPISALFLSPQSSSLFSLLFFLPPPLSLCLSLSLSFTPSPSLSLFLSLSLSLSYPFLFILTLFFSSALHSYLSPILGASLPCVRRCLSVGLFLRIMSKSVYMHNSLHLVCICHFLDICLRRVYDVYFVRCFCDILCV